LTAFETVSNIVTNKKDKTNIWNVNTEQEFHDEIHQNSTQNK